MSSTVLAHPVQKTREGKSLRAVAMPMGGIGTGTIALAGDGSLRQWQIHNQVNHLACVPHSFFAIWARRVHPSVHNPVARVLQSDTLYDADASGLPMTTNDYVVPTPHRDLLQTLPGVESTTFTGAYPVAGIAYHDEAIPLQVTLESFNPFEPLNAEDSGIPVVCFNFTITNPTDEPWQASIAGMLQNAVGWDGLAPITGTNCQHYGGNTNSLIRKHTGTTLSMGNAWLPEDAAGNGTMVLSVNAPDVTWLTQWDSLTALWDDFRSDGRFGNLGDTSPSASGQTWNGALAAHVTLAPGESRTIPFRIAWHFPNRYVNWNQRLFLHFHDTKSKLFIGNHYATRFQSAVDVIDYVALNNDRLTDVTRLSRDTFHDSTLPPSLLESVTAPISIIRSPTCFRTADGNFYGFEGCNGASTRHHTEPWGGSCPLNCTHVWNYEMTLSRLFPDLERTMRATEWHLQQRQDGSLPHRVLLPTYLPRNENGIIGAPDNPAVDGLFGAILKTWREYLVCGDAAWLREMWPGVKHALTWVWTNLDPGQTGVIEGEQPNTYDISIYGANTFIGTLYLAALRATEEMAKVLHERDLANDCRRIFLHGSAELDARLWNGEYYVQDVDLGDHPEQNWASGCHIDHLFGQWWAWALNLGDLLDSERLRIATASIFRHNFREDFHHRHHNPRQYVRQYVSTDDSGTLICTWPNGGRPEIATLYSDEVWSGLEYELAALLIFSGHPNEAIKVTTAVRERLDGTKQSPWNEIECGDHYVRAMSSWTILEAATGFHYNAGTQSLTVNPALMQNNLRAPFVTGEGWGTLAQHDTGTTITVRSGQLTLATATINGYELTYPEPVTIAAGETWNFPGRE